ncbi:hypothetical protein [Vibrio sp. WXL210]|uniref:hypothetical protein n=1 Tax=Vibrio sp. WXL210 TaxID=3450709 RepID=UPI003EC774AE
MARVSAAEMQRRKEELFQDVFELVLEHGLHNVTYQMIREKTGKTISTIQNSIPTIDSIGRLCLTGRAFPYLLERLNFGTRESFIDSFVKAAETDRGTRNILALFFGNAYGDEATSKFSKAALNRLLDKLSSADGIGQAHAYPTLETAFGRAALAMMASPLEVEREDEFI